jgi:hypothetical protein
MLFSETLAIQLISLYLYINASHPKAIEKLVIVTTPSKLKIQDKKKKSHFAFLQF